VVATASSPPLAEELRDGEEAARFSPCYESVTVSKRKFIFVTGGVLSSRGKGLPQPPLGRSWRAGGCGHLQKLDPYINVDPGTMNPFQHGEFTSRRRR